MEDKKCDMCGESFTGEVHPVYDENFNIQDGLIQCYHCAGFKEEQETVDVPQKETDFPLSIKSVTHCPTCGSECTVGGNTTHYYIPKNGYSEEEVKIEKIKAQIEILQWVDINDDLEIVLKNLQEQLKELEK